MRIQISRQENIEEKIQELKNQILQLIEISRTKYNSTNIARIQRLQKEYWSLEMERDIPDMSVDKRKELLEYISEFFTLGIKKGYFTNENMLDVLKQLTCGISKFELVPDLSLNYGAWQGRNGDGTFKIKKTLNSELFRHVTMHELTHCVTMPNLEWNEVYKTKNIPRIRVNNSEQKKSDKEKKHEIHITGKAEYVFQATRIIAELIAESTACDLCDSYGDRTYVGNKDMRVTSDWMVPYNRAYHQLGDEFLQSLHFINNDVNTTDRMRFKALTIMSLDPNNQIIQTIIREYREKGLNGIDDLHFISECLEKINELTYVPQDVFERFRNAIKKYMPENWRPDEYLDEVVETPSIHIKPQSITEKSRQTIRISPGQLSNGVDTARRHIKIPLENI